MPKTKTKTKTKSTKTKAKSTKAKSTKRSSAPGPKVLELAQVAKGADRFSTSVQIDLGRRSCATLSLWWRGRGCTADVVYPELKRDTDSLPAPTFERGMLNLAARWPDAAVRLDSVKTYGPGTTVRGRKLEQLAQAAWAEAFGMELESEEQRKQAAAQQSQTASEWDKLAAKIRAKGADVWNDLNHQLQDRFDLQGVDLSAAGLDGIVFFNRDLRGANFAKSSLIQAKLMSSRLDRALFTSAKLPNANFNHASLSNANFRDADLRGAHLNRSKLQGADFTGAKLQGAEFFKAHFDDKTVFPAGFKPPTSMIWKGAGERPGLKRAKAAKAGSLDFESFLGGLTKKVDVARFKKATSMLKAEKFQLFADVKDDSLVGIVKSQTDKDLVYSCRLTAQGNFSCCTQNLRPCGGLHGALCKHLLVLIVGLAKAGQLDAAKADYWVELSRRQKPAIDEDLMSATFLRYKGAEAGEIDWRPTETIPEDFYAM